MSINQNILLAASNSVENATVSGGAAAIGFPLSNLQSRAMYEFCRFNSLSRAETYVVLTYSSATPIQLVATLKHNFSGNSKWRIRIGNTEADVISAPVYDSGWISIFPALGDYGTKAWGEFSWGDVVAESLYGDLNRHAVHLLQNKVSAKVVRIDYDDEAENPDGYLQFARLFISSIYQPSLNVPYGAKVVIKDNTKSKESDSGVRFYGTRYIRRSLIADLELPQREFIRSLFGTILLPAGTDREVLAILQPLEPDNYVLELVYGNFRNWSDMTHASWDRMSTQLDIDEKV